MSKIRLGNIAVSLKRTLRQFPVEMGIVAYAIIVAVLFIEDVEIPHEENLALAPLFFALAYCLNNLIKCPRGRWAYYLCWIPILPLWLVDVEDWILSAGYCVTAICLFLGFLMCRKAKDNTRFAKESVDYIFNLFVAFCYAGVAHLLLMAIYYSVNYIFGLDNWHWQWEHFMQYSSLVAYVAAVPLMFLTFCSANLDKELRTSRFFDVLLNYIVTPALLIYTVILYVYFVTIAVQWSLPKTSIALMVFAFTITAVLVKAWQPLLGKRVYDWFFDRFSLISLPAIIMFWIATLYRIGEYGFTQLRMYLLLCGVIMTVTLAMFVCRGKGRYIYVALFASALFALFTYIPPISAKNIAIRSQKATVVRTAGELGMLDGEGVKFLPADELPAADSTKLTEYSKIYSALDYLEDEDQPLFGFGSADDFSKIYPSWKGSDIVERDAEESFYLSRNFESADISGYSTMRRIHSYRDESGEYYYSSDNDSLKIFRVAGGTEENEAGEAMPPAEAAAEAAVAEAAAAATAGATEIETATEEPAAPELNDDLIYAISFDDLMAAQLEKIGATPKTVSRAMLEENRGEILELRTEQFMLVLDMIHVEFTAARGVSVSSVSVEFILMK